MASLLQRIGWRTKLWYPREWSPRFLERLGVNHRSSYEEIEEAILRYLAGTRGIETGGKSEREVVLEIFGSDLEILERQREREGVNAILDEASIGAAELERAETAAKLMPKRYLHFLNRGTTK